MNREELRKQDIRDLWAVLHTREGARFLSRLFDMTRLFSISFVPGDGSATAFNEGARNVGLSIYADTLDTGEDVEPLLRRARAERQITTDEDNKEVF